MPSKPPPLQKVIPMDGRSAFSRTLLADAEPEPDELVKLVLIGDSGVGKTNFLQQFVSQTFQSNTKTTITAGFAIKTLQIGGKTVRAQIWDTAGQERYRAVNSSYYHGALGALLLYDITYSVSFRSVEQWLKELRTHAGAIPVVLVGNKSDLAERRSIPTDDGMRFAESQELLFIEASALNATNVPEAFTTLITTIVSHLSAPRLDGTGAVEVLQHGEPVERGCPSWCCG
jgi:small GTP-binding protein